MAEDHLLRRDAPADQGDRDRAHVLRLLRRYGWNSVSFQILEPGFRHWFNRHNACVGYVDTGKAWVVGGPPVAPSERLRDVALAFSAGAARVGRRAVFLATESRFVEATGWPAFRIGYQPVWNPVDWTGTVAGARSLREQLRRARAKGVTVRRLDADELSPGQPMRAQVDALIARWLDAQPMAPMGFLVQVHPYMFPEERNCFVALLKGRLMGFLGVIPVYARQGWFFEDFLSDPSAPNGTVEVLVDAGMQAAAAKGVRYVTLGLVPLAGDVSAWLRVVRRWSARLYNFEGLLAFKAKFKPCAWDPIFLSHPPGGSAGVALMDTLAAFAQGGLLTFGVQTLLRGRHMTGPRTNGGLQPAMTASWPSGWLGNQERSLERTIRAAPQHEIGVLP